MGIILKDDEYKDFKFDSYNKLNRIESLDLSTGTGLIRMAKYSSKEHRTHTPGDLIENRDFHTITIEGEDLTGLQDLIYSYINKLDTYKDGVKA